MKYNFKPKSDLDKFGYKIYFLLVENFPQTFFVGGMVRDMLLGRKIIDIDIATEALPEEAAELLLANGIAYDDTNKKYGSLTAISNGHKIEITTLRKDLKAQNRYPKVSFVKDIKTDSQRRDFTVNSLYFSPKTAIIFDFHKGLPDLKNRLIRFIGDPKARITEDPLRIIRALRFALVLDFDIESKSVQAIKNNFKEIKRLTKSKMRIEIEKIGSTVQREKIERVINNPKSLDSILK